MLLLVQSILTLVGALYLGTLAIALVTRLYQLHLQPPVSTAKYDAGQGGWAVVTGASDGIGKEFALQLAKKKFNVVLLARTRSKLEAVSDEAKKLASGVETKVIPFDFMNAKPSDYESLGKTLSELNVTVLVNNVAVNHDIPIPFVDEEASVIEGIVDVNIKATMKVTRLVLPSMIAKEKGIIMNLGSFAGQVPTGFLSVYSASKAWLKSWSLALNQELRPKGVMVQHLNTYFVTTSMSKIRKPSVTTPTAKDYVNSVINSLGKGPNVTPFWSHSWAEWVMTRFVPESVLIAYSASLNAGIRKRALAKKDKSKRNE
ncbi:hypothetical protein SeMB42_g04020 [Synchytrium endobioticum]|uniref:Very-long-chain 3-oxoacyl-CoA reductase n=1 Tax=Synchytrium endobioticum TaxID=286115 RepID=A0A507D273_9FUNG|nr:hypothetical protein SeLEV6574_g06059 [Synchytrium endobioticum]TPX45401.1 hypothetical protein SeMB42_g04020 [Synchytrium endobioticum]